MIKKPKHSSKSAATDSQGSLLLWKMLRKGEQLSSGAFGYHSDREFREGCLLCRVSFWLITQDLLCLLPPGQDHFHRKFLSHVFSDLNSEALKPEKNLK